MTTATAPATVRGNFIIWILLKIKRRSRKTEDRSIADSRLDI